MCLISCTLEKGKTVMKVVESNCLECQLAINGIGTKQCMERYKQLLEEEKNKKKGYEQLKLF